MKPRRGVTPIAFGGFADGSKLAGRYHAPLGAPSGIGVVLCSPGGVEEIWSYAAYRALAERLAARGAAVLRFDYHGQGDSSSDDGAPGRIPAWKDSVSFAIDELIARSGVTSVRLYGLRLGATVAATVAAQRGGVDAIAIWAPVSGRVFVREFRVYRKLNPPAPAPVGRELPAGDEEAAGFLLTAETLGALADLDITKLTKAPARRALILAKDAASNEQKVAARFASLGVQVTERSVPGYAAMMLEPRKAVLPTAALDLVTDWLCEVPPAGFEAAPKAEAEAPANIVTRAPYRTTATVHEEPLHFGSDQKLFGVLTEPAEKNARARTALLFLTVAVHHRIGAHRTHVKIAREAAARGFTALRFDIAGVGDSASSIDAPHPYAFGPVQDVIAAIDALQRRGVERFVLAGLCSGAFLAYHTALREPRTSGIALLNPQVFYFNEGDSLEIGRGTVYKSTRSYRSMLTSPESWRRLLNGEVNVRFIGGMLAERMKRRAELRIREVVDRVRGVGPAAQSVKRDFRAICGRGTRALLIFSAVDEGIDNLEAHLGGGAKAMRRYPAFEMEIVDGPDHSFVPIWSQERLSQILCDYLEKRFG